MLQTCLLILPCTGWSDVQRGLVFCFKFRKKSTPILILQDIGERFLSDWERSWFHYEYEFWWVRSWTGNSESQSRLLVRSYYVLDRYGYMVQLGRPWCRAPCGLLREQFSLRKNVHCGHLRCLGRGVFRGGGKVAYTLPTRIVGRNFETPEFLKGCGKWEE